MCSGPDLRRRERSERIYAPEEARPRQPRQPRRPRRPRQSDPGDSQPGDSAFGVRADALISDVFGAEDTGDSNAEEAVGTKARYKSKAEEAIRVPGGVVTLTVSADVAVEPERARTAIAVSLDEGKHGAGYGYSQGEGGVSVRSDGEVQAGLDASVANIAQPLNATYDKDRIAPSVKQSTDKGIYSKSDVKFDSSGFKAKYTVGASDTPSLTLGVSGGSATASISVPLIMTIGEAKVSGSAEIEISFAPDPPPVARRHRRPARNASSWGAWGAAIMFVVGASLVSPGLGTAAAAGVAGAFLISPEEDSRY
jgi:hypothetical protein